MSRNSFVEMDSGEQEYFENPYLAFKFAKEQEKKQKNSVSYVAIGGVYNENISLSAAMNEVSVYRGQQLRYMIRSLDNTIGWIRTQLEEQQNAKDRENS